MRLTHGMPPNQNRPAERFPNQFKMPDGPESDVRQSESRRSDNEAEWIHHRMPPVNRNFSASACLRAALAKA
jgi:hypothetical protein